MNSSSLTSLNGSPKHVKVLIRTRPTSEFASDNVTIGSDQKSIGIHIKKSEDGGYINNQQDRWDFKFDGIMHNASQEAVYDMSAATIVSGLFEGYNGTVLAYGQTGAGKTFSMVGATENYKHRGVIPRAISQVFAEIGQQPQMAITVRISYLEIYNETMVDLLNPASSSSTKDDTSGLTVLDDKTGVVTVKGLTTQVATSEEDALNFLFEGETNRSVSDHQMNKSSTRSHCIFTIYLESRPRNESSERVIHSKLNLVDLAGSERLSKTGSKGATQREAMHINKSLTFLEQVILALADKKRDHIPYRQSRLTNVLRDALGGNCNTLMIANVRGERDHLEETISTLRFATRMMCVTTTPVVNVQFDPMALVRKYEKEIRQLKQELAMHDALANRSHVPYEPFTDSQRLELQKKLKYFLEHDDDDFEVVNLRQVKEVLNQFRLTYRNLNAELQDQQRRIPAVTAPTTLSNTNIANSAEKNDNAKDSKAAAEEHVVGDSDGFGFGVGVVKGGAAAKAGKPKKSSSQQQAHPPVAAALPATASAIVSSTANATYLSSGVTPASRVVSMANLNSSVHDDAEKSAIGEALEPMRVSHIIAPSRAEEFESFKRGKGAELNRILTENKTNLREKKLQAKLLSATVNEIKAKIDELSAATQPKHSERLQKGISDKQRSRRKPFILLNRFNLLNEDGSVIIGEAEYAILTELKSFKRQYREHHEAFVKVKNELDYCTRLVDQSRKKLMLEFDAWFESLYGAAIAGDAVLTKRGGNGDAGEEGLGEELMDVGEKFDKLQLERILKEDPESFAFYNARRNQERRKASISTTQKSSGIASVPGNVSNARRRSSSRIAV